MTQEPTTHGDRMAFCPQCNGEFQPWVAACPDCGVPLTEKPVVPGKTVRNTREEPLVQVAKAPNEIVARLWADFLEDNGIPVLVRSLGPGIGAWGSAVFMEHGLYVLAPDEREARQLLQQLSAEGGPEEED